MAEIRKPKGATRKPRVRGKGPGSGNGTTAGRGTKGQNARSGGGVRLGFEGGQMPLYRRIARRGFNNSQFQRVVQEVSLAQLEHAFDSGATVDIAALVDEGLIHPAADDAKVLANGKVTKSLTLQGIRVSAGARNKIEAAGGTVTDR